MPPNRDARYAAGKALRDRVPREQHGEWQPPHDRRPPVDLVIESSHGRIPELVPIRYGRMSVSPFTFYRGAANLMAADLAGTPATGVRVQVCGDCHLLNFGAFAALCGWTLARAHARSGDPAMIAGYLGKSDRFDTAVARFSLSYADQAERDHAAMMDALRQGRIEAEFEH